MTRIIQAVASLLGSLVFASLILLLSRRGKLSMRYTLGWLFVALSIFVGGSVAGLATPFADAVGTEPIYVIFAGAVVVLLLIMVQLSITASGLFEMIRRLAESNALLEERVRRLSSSFSVEGLSAATSVNDASATQGQTENG